MRDILTFMVKDLIYSRVLDDYRIDGKYHKVIIDATQLHSYDIKHTEGSLVTHHSSGEVTYHNDTLAATLVFGNVSAAIDFEWIENSEVGYVKQDCELNAAKRLLRRLKKTYKSLSICIGMDALYLGEPILEICKENR